ASARARPHRAAQGGRVGRARLRRGHAGDRGSGLPSGAGRARSRRVGGPGARPLFADRRRLGGGLSRRAVRLRGLPAVAAGPARGDREAAIARALTRRHEEILRGTLSDLRERVARRASLRGEATVLVAGAAEAEPARDVASIDEELRAGRAAGRGLRELAAEIARRTGMSRREVYRRGLALEQE